MEKFQFVISVSGRCDPEDVDDSVKAQRRENLSVVGPERLFIDFHLVDPSDMKRTPETAEQQNGLLL